MKRLLHALAALWPKCKEVVSPSPPPASAGLRQHLAAVLRMERYLSESTDTCSHKRNAVTPDTRPARQEVERSGSTSHRTERSDGRRLSRKAGSEAVGINERNVVTPGTRPARREVKRTGSTANRPERSDVPTRATVGIDDSPNQQIVGSTTQPQSLPRIPQPMPLLTILMLVFFMCLMAAKQVSAQAEPAEAAKWDDVKWTPIGNKQISKPINEGLQVGD